MQTLEVQVRVVCAGKTRDGQPCSCFTDGTMELVTYPRMTTTHAGNVYVAQDHWYHHEHEWFCATCYTLLKDRT